jgi:hypothetical protein
VELANLINSATGTSSGLGAAGATNTPCAHSRQYQNRRIRSLVSQILMGLISSTMNKCCSTRTAQARLPSACSSGGGAGGGGGA